MFSDYFSKLIVLIKNNYLLISLLILAGIMFFVAAGREPLSSWDECIYAQYGKEMHQTGNLLTYTWNSEKIFEKPSLYGILMQPFVLFESTDLSYRIPTILFSLGLITLIYFLTSKYFSKLAALLAVSIFLTARENILGYLWRVNTDVGFSFFIIASLVFWFLSYQYSYAIYFFGLFLGLSTLHKGLLTFLYIIPFIANVVYSKDKILLKKMLHGLVVYTLIILPWHVYQYIAYRNNFIFEYFYDHLWKRTIYNLLPKENVFYYLKELYLDLNIWFIIVGVFVIFSIYHKKRSFIFIKLFVISKLQTRFVITLSLFTLIPLLTLSFIQTKVVWYVFPVYVSISILLGIFIERILSISFSKKIQTLLLTFAILFGLICVGLETEPFKMSAEYSDSYNAFKELQKLPVQNVYYFVDPQYRGLYFNEERKYLIPATFRYGQDSCVAYYSNKRVVVEYNEQTFRKYLENRDGAYLMRTEDMKLFGLNEKDLVYKNNKYSVFRMN